MKIIENLKTAPNGKRVALSPRISYNQSFNKPISYSDAIEVHSEISFEITQIINDSGWVTDAAERAKRVLAREMYGEVIDRLYHIREKLWENGPLYDDKVLEAVESLIGDLTP